MSNARSSQFKEALILLIEKINTSVDQSNNETMHQTIRETMNHAHIAFNNKSLYRLPSNAFLQLPLQESKNVEFPKKRKKSICLYIEILQKP